MRCPGRTSGLNLMGWGQKDPCPTQPPSHNTSPGANTGLRLPAPRQAHSEFQYTDTYVYCLNSAVVFCLSVEFLGLL